MSASRRSEADGVELRAASAPLERAAALLAAGPLSTLALAERVLGVRGSERSAAAAVFGLLGTDARFRVDASGTWSLSAPPAPALPGSLRDEEWVVVDVETTGGAPQHGHRVTEVAAVWVSRGEITRTFATLVNPERRIPGMITALTGITDAMVRDAPRFHEIAPRVAGAMRGRVFVAHNAPFDWRFLCAEMDRAAGKTLDGRQLCTVRLARKLLPELTSRNLDSLAHYFGLEIEDRHRALDDAVATAKVLIRFVEILEDRGVTDWQDLQSLLAKRAPRRKRTRMPKSMDSA